MRTSKHHCACIHTPVTEGRRERALPFPVSSLKPSLTNFVALNTNLKVIKLALAIHVANFNSYCYNIKKYFNRKNKRGVA